MCVFVCACLCKCVFMYEFVCACLLLIHLFTFIFTSFMRGHIFLYLSRMANRMVFISTEQHRLRGISYKTPIDEYVNGRTSLFPRADEATAAYRDQ